VTTKWLWAINKHLVEDKIIATKVKQTKQAKWIVKDTWEKVLQTEGELPDRWMFDNKVLVGRRPCA
jgi:hypothetical protein